MRSHLQAHKKGINLRQTGRSINRIMLLLCTSCVSFENSPLTPLRQTVVWQGMMFIHTDAAQPTSSIQSILSEDEGLKTKMDAAHHAPLINRSASSWSKSMASLNNAPAQTSLNPPCSSSYSNLYSSFDICGYSRRLSLGRNFLTWYSYRFWRSWIADSKDKSNISSMSSQYVGRSSSWTRSLKRNRRQTTAFRYFLADSIGISLRLYLFW